MNHPTTRTSCYPSVDQADVFRMHKVFTSHHHLSGASRRHFELQQQEDLRLPPEAASGPRGMPIGLIKPPGLPLVLEQVYTALDDIRSITKDAPAMGITPAEVGAIWGKLDIARINLNVFLHTRDWSQFKCYPVLP
jgi:hypothetical protein